MENQLKELIAEKDNMIADLMTQVSQRDEQIAELKAQVPSEKQITEATEADMTALYAGR